MADINLGVYEIDDAQCNVQNEEEVNHKKVHVVGHDKRKSTMATDDKHDRINENDDTSSSNGLSERPTRVRKNKRHAMRDDYNPFDDLDDGFPEKSAQKKRMRG